MSRVCQLTGKKPQFGHNVSHSNRKTNRRFLPNIQKVSLTSEALGRDVSMKVSTRALRTVLKKGGLDQFLLQTEDQKLPEAALRLKRSVKKVLGKAAKAVEA
ncbi:MAG: 50S ribosomal protein L28 [Myxococcota bacterium]|nr:50S ribosomal protein L28 [Myxococcota bacterium]